MPTKYFFSISTLRISANQATMSVQLGATEGDDWKELVDEMLVGVSLPVEGLDPKARIISVTVAGLNPQRKTISFECVEGRNGRWMLPF